MPPIHPGEILKEMYLEPLAMTVAAFSADIGVTSRRVSLILNGHSGISAELALRLSNALNTTPELWLNMQRDHDLWHAKRNVKVSSIKNINPAS